VHSLAIVAKKEFGHTTNCSGTAQTATVMRSGHEIERIYDEHAEPPLLTGSRHWNDLQGWEQDKYLLACFNGERIRAATEERLRIFDRIAGSIQYHLLGPFYQRAPDAPLYEPPSLETAEKVKMLRALALADTPLGRRLFQAIGRAELVRERGIEPATLVYDNDVPLKFEYLHPFAKLRGWEMLAEESFGGYETSAHTPPTVSKAARDTQSPTVSRAASRPDPTNDTWQLKALTVVVAMLLWALLPINPYGYYVLLRWVVSATFALLGREAWQRKANLAAIAYGWFAVLYNPLAPIPLARAAWSVINLATIGALVWTMIGRHHARLASLRAGGTTLRT
jgi:hypothetical protein